MKTRQRKIFFGNLLQKHTEEKLAGLGFSLALILPSLLALVAVACFTLFDVSENSDTYLYVSYLLMPLAFCLILRQSAVWSGKECPVRSFWSENRCSGKYYALAFVLQCGLLPLGMLNTAFLEFLGKFGYQNTQISLPSMDGFGFFGVLLVVAVLPAIFEELMFRGLLLRGLKSFGTVGATLLCGALFAFYHQNPAQTIYQFGCGAAFALMAIRANSVFPTIVSHFVNNALILVLTKFGIESFPVWVIAICSLCLFGAFAWLLFKEKNGEKSSDSAAKKRAFFRFASVGLVVCATNWLFALLTGFGG